MLVKLFFFICVIALLNVNKIEKFMEYNDLIKRIYGNYNQYYKNQITRETTRADDLNHDIDTEINEYNQQFCSKYSKLYKLNPDSAYVDKQKTYIVPETYTRGVYSSDTKTCVHPSDPLFNNYLDCSQKIQCQNGMLISGQNVLKDTIPTCVYECI